MPGGRSYLAKLLEDAGGDYLWKNSDSYESMPISIENVIEKAINADIWINPDAATNLNDITSIDKRLNNIKAFKEKKVFNNNKRYIKSGGNDYWESGVVNPNLVLKDLISIIHPELLNENSYFYYRKLD